MKPDTTHGQTVHVNGWEHYYIGPIPHAYQKHAVVNRSGTVLNVWEWEIDPPQEDGEDS